MASVSDWSANEKENTHIDELTLSGDGGLYTNKIMCAVKEKMDEVDGKLAKVQGAYVFKGTKATVADLPATGNETGDVWNVTALGGGDYAWTGEAWDALGPGEAASTYCADCNAALTPGRYYIDENTANSPDGSAGIMLVESRGGDSGTVWQTVRIDSTGDQIPVYIRKVMVSSGSYSSSKPWKLNGYYAAYSDFRSLFLQTGSTIVFSPLAGRKLPAQPDSIYEFARFYHSRDASRDASGESYGFLGRQVSTTAPTSSSGNYAYLVIGESCGGLTSNFFRFGAKYRCSSNVVYTDETEETVYGVYLKEGDEYNSKTVASVSYDRKPAEAPWFLFDSDNFGTLGTSTYRWATVYAGTGSIDTSDERLKDYIENIPDVVLDAWGDVGWVQYKFKDAVATKGGAAARLHSGMIAQRIDAVFKAHGLDASQYGLFCYDAWEDEYDIDENGVQHKVKDAGDRYSLRYEECFAMEAAYQRRRADRIETRLSALEAKLNGLD